MTDNDTKQGQVIIALTDRRPIRICTLNWPVVSSAERVWDWNGAVTARCFVSIRQHADGRMIVEAAYTLLEGPAYLAAELFEIPLPHNIGSYIKGTIGVALSRQINGGGSESVLVNPAIDEAVANLPPEDLV